MTYENNYAWPGVTAIIYNIVLDLDFLGFYIWQANNAALGSTTVVMLPQDTNITEFGIQFKKNVENPYENMWVTLTLLNSDQIDSIKNQTKDLSRCIQTTKSNIKNDASIANKYVISDAQFNKDYNFISPIRVVIKELDQNQSYTMRSYYKTGGIRRFYNECTVTTMIENDIHYECTGVTGGTDSQNETLRSIINEGCEIYNCMTNFKKSTSQADSLNSKTGGQFTGTYDPTLYQQGAAAHSGMVFASYEPNISTVVHEMAHNVMYDRIDDRENEFAREKIGKFMEFATNCEKASWRWQSAHNYPVISSAKYKDAYNYIVAAATQVCREASNKY